MKKFGMFVCALAALTFGFTSCNDKEKSKIDLDTVIEDGFYVVGEATPVASIEAANLQVGLMGAGTNEVTKSKRDGMYEKYIYLVADKEFSLVLHEQGKQDVYYGAELEEKTAITDNDAEVQLTELWGQLKTNATLKVAQSGLYHIILDLNLTGDLDNMGGAQIVVLPCEWGLRGWSGDWGFRGMEIVEQSATKIVYKYTPEGGEETLEAAGSFKFAHSNCWKFNLDMSGAVKAENSIGTNASEDGGAYTELLGGGKNIPYRRGIYDYVTLTWELKGGAVAKSFTFETHRSGTLEVANPAEFVVGISGSALVGQDGKEVGGWSDPAGYALAVFDETATTVDDQETLAGTYVYNITDLTFNAGSEFKLRFNGEWIGPEKANVALLGVNTTATDGGNFSAVTGSFNIKFTVAWNGDNWTSIKAEFTEGQQPQEIEYVSGSVYVINNTGMEANELYLYGYGDSELFGSWAGAQAEANAVTIDNVEYLEFKSDKMIAGGKYRFIINNNNGWQTGNMDDEVTLDAENKAYLRANSDKTMEVVK